MIIRILFVVLLFSCSKQEVKIPIEEEMEDITVNLDSTVQVLSVDFSGSEQNYNFRVELASPDTGCEQYADWWEVITTDGSLIYRRNLGHSHVNEQPFTRSGGGVKISAQDSVIVRGHMNTFGYGNLIMKGTVDGGFNKDTLSSTFAEDLASMAPLPPKCAF